MTEPVPIALAPTRRQRRRCPNCDSSRFTETTSRERCRACGYEVDYHGKGGNAVADAFEDQRAYADETARWSDLNQTGDRP